MYEVSSSNHDLHKCAYFVKKIVPREQRGRLWWWSVGWDIFILLYFAVFEFSLFLFSIN
jgi:hypothetical protein